MFHIESLSLRRKYLRDVSVQTGTKQNSYLWKKPRVNPNIFIAVHAGVHVFI